MYRRVTVFVLSLIVCFQPAWGADSRGNQPQVMAGTVPSSLVSTVCDQFPERLSQEQAERMTVQVKDGFPAKYRAALDKVAIMVSPGNSLELGVAMIGSRYELTISAGYARNMCVLMMATLPIGSDPPPVTDRFTLPSDCSRATARFQCLIAYLTRANSKREQGVAAAGLLQQWGPSILATLRGALLYGIAHEYGHVVGDIDPQLLPLQRKIDPELTADIAGLYLITSGVAPPQVDGMYFGGLRVVDLAHLSQVAAASSHEPIICRARRTIDPALKYWTQAA
jgi:hypothetical protein